MTAQPGFTYAFADFTTVNGGVTPGMQWQGVFENGTIGTSLYKTRTPRAAMSALVKQNASITLSVFMVNADTGAALDALTLTITQKKPGGAFASIAPVVTPRSNGYYDIAFVTAQTDTLGVSDFHITAPGASDNDELKFQVVAFDPNDVVRMGQTALPNAAAGALGGLPSNAIRTATAQGPGTGTNQIQLDAGASSVDGFYSRSLVSIIGNTGAGQSRSIASYVGATKTASLNKPWGTAPDNTSVFQITAASNNLLTEGLAQGGTANTITFRANDSAQDDLYKDEWVQVTSGTGMGQARLISGYVGATKVATVNVAWKINPDSTSVYQILTGAQADVGALAGDVTAVTNLANTFNGTGYVNANAPATQGSLTAAVTTIDNNTTSVVNAAVTTIDNNTTSVVGAAVTTIDNNTTSVVGAAVTTIDNNTTSVVSAAVIAIDNNTTSVVNAGVTAVNAHIDAALAGASFPTTGAIRDAILDTARSGHLTTGTIGEGIALAAALLQGNVMIDQVNNSNPNGPTSQRIRCWVSAAAMAGATPGGTGQGEFATFLVTTAYAGPNQITLHTVVQQ